MARIKGAVNAKKKHKRILKLAKGYYGAKSKIFRTANTQVIRALRSAFEGRKRKKRDFRKFFLTMMKNASIATSH